MTNPSAIERLVAEIKAAIGVGKLNAAGVVEIRHLADALAEVDARLKRLEGHRR